MNFNSIIATIKHVILNNYCNFKGRASRPEFWTLFLLNAIVTMIFNMLGKFGMYVSLIWALALLLPFLGVSVRRLHDINKSGWALLVFLIPFIGQIILIIWWAKKGDANDNQYGPVPQTPTADTVS